MKDKIEELETRYSFQEDLLQQLNDIVVAQQKQLDLQAQQLHVLHTHLQELRDSVQLREADSGQEKPPHY